LDAAWSKFLEVLDRVTAPFLSVGSMFSLSSLACALGIAIALIAWRLRSRRRRIRLRVILRALFPRRITFHASTGVDVSYLIFNTFIFGAMFSWALFSFRAISNGTINVLTSAFGTPVATTLPEFSTRAALTVVLFLAYEICYWLHHYLCHRVPFLWEFHKVHHSANVLTPITVFRVHPVDTWLFANMMSVVVGAANGVANYAVGITVYQYMLTDTNLILVVFIHVYIHFQHSHLWIAFRGLAGRILLSPAHHQVHHSANPAHFNKNLGSCLAVWDWMFGTLHVPAKAPERLNFGVEAGGRDIQTITEAYLASFPRAAQSMRGSPRPAAGIGPDPTGERLAAEDLAAIDLAPVRQN
jgi:sterol desaturase/sphingolipid hydroxylase (fatty acid hydroxylase superfamily)